MDTIAISCFLSAVTEYIQRVKKLFVTIAL